MELCKRCHLLCFGDKSLLYQVKNMEFCLKANHFIRTTNFFLKKKNRTERLQPLVNKFFFFVIICVVSLWDVNYGSKQNINTKPWMEKNLSCVLNGPYRECDQAYANRWYVSSVQSAKPIKLNKKVGKVPWNLNSRNLKSLIYWRGDTILPTAGSDNGEYDQIMGGMWSWNQWHLHKISHFNINFFCFM